jgi:hypothetical protein
VLGLLFLACFGDADVADLRAHAVASLPCRFDLLFQPENLDSLRIEPFLLGYYLFL